MGACWALHLQLRSVSLRLFSCNLAVQLLMPQLLCRCITQTLT